MESKEVNLFISGDFCPINRIEKKILSKELSDVFNSFGTIIKDADLAITNLECPLTQHDTAINKTGPALKGIPEAGSFLRDSGFNLVTLANNHILDYGVQGLTDTITILKNNNVEFIGAALAKENVSNSFLYSDKGVKIAILNICENEWSTLEEIGANPIDLIKNFNKIKALKKTVDKLVLITHGGHELFEYPSPQMKELFRFYVDAGADAVINHHTHYISGYEVYKDAPIFYSIGNFLFDNDNYRNSKWNVGLAISLKVSKETIKFEILSFDQCNEFAGVALHDVDKSATIIEQIDEINSIINDDEALHKKFVAHVKRMERQYLAYLEPHKNKFIFALQNRGLFPRLSTKKKKLLLLNLIRCESHREALISILKNENSIT